VTPVEELARTQLVARRQQLAGLATERREERLVDLLRRVDSALAALEVGEWGICAICQEPMDPRRLVDDPLVTVCLECLAPAERRALERDLEAAARVQRALLPPRELRHDGWEMAHLWEPRGPVSGDHVDVVRPAGGCDPLHLLLGDVMGKGLAASLLQAHLHALFRALASPAISLGELLGRANRVFCEATGGSRYATLVAVRLHADGRVELANAGHPRPLIADSRGVRPVEGAGMPLGLFAGAEYEPRELWLPPGATLLLYTDGWTEAQRGDEELGIGRAASALARGARLPLPELLDECRGEIERFLGGDERGDDLTLVALRRSAPF
jgi:sigma-B regulation protein RsbU (phosphoserine phosphatase)